MAGHSSRLQTKRIKQIYLMLSKDWGKMKGVGVGDRDVREGLNDRARGGRRGREALGLGIGGQRGGTVG